MQHPLRNRIEPVIIRRNQMGRPLKIAKAQAVVTITNTTAATDLVTTNANFTNLGIIAGMPFVVATNIGGLVAGTLYWILSVVNAGNNSTFTVSATPLNANPTSTPVDLSTASGTVSATVAPVDAYFNNPIGPEWPATNANTYSVVGGNTAIFGSQVLCNVAIGQNGEGTLYGATTSNVIGGLGTDLGNIAADTVIQYIDASGQAVTLGYVDTATGVTTVEISNATATGNFLTTVGNAETLYANLPVTLDADIGGLTAGTTYFVKAIPNATAFTVSLTPGGANVGLTNEDATSNASQDTSILTANASANVSGASFIYATPEAGYIVRQKGKQKYLVKGTSSGLVAPCYTANVANTAMLPNTMTITATYANAATQLVQSLNDRNIELFTANSGPIATGNIVLQDADPAYATFNSAIAANAAAGQPYPIVTIDKA
jgi:hypothetical protein